MCDLELPQHSVQLTSVVACISFSQTSESFFFIFTTETTIVILWRFTIDEIHIFDNFFFGMALGNWATGWGWPDFDLFFYTKNLHGGVIFLGCFFKIFFFF